MHGPTPRDYAQRTPKKMKAAALRGALSDRARDGSVHVLSALVDGDPVHQGRARRAARVSSTASTPRRRSSATDELDLEEPAQRARGAPARARPAEHLRRAGQRRRRVHPAALDEFVVGRRQAARHSSGRTPAAEPDDGRPTEAVTAERAPRPTESSRSARGRGGGGR